MQTAAGTVLIYRFVCHPSMVYVTPTIVYVTSFLIPVKPEEVGGEVGSSFRRGMIWDVAPSSGSMYEEVQCPYKGKKTATSLDK